MTDETRHLALATSTTAATAVTNSNIEVTEMLSASTVLYKIMVIKQYCTILPTVGTYNYCPTNDYSKATIAQVNTEII